MSKHDTILRTAASGAILGLALAGSAHASVESNPFSATELNAGYRLAAADEARCGANAAKGKASEAKCGSDKATEAKCGAAKEKGEKKAIREAKCGEAKCGGNR